MNVGFTEFTGHFHLVVSHNGGHLCKDQSLMPWRKAALCRMHSHQQHHVSLTTQRAGSPVKVSQHYRTFQLENESKRVLEI